MKKLLSIDGGGYRGVIPLSVIAWLEEKLGGPVSKYFDLIAGTSTGGIVACGLTHTTDGKTPTYSAQSLLSLYKDEGETIFPHHWDDDLVNKLRVKYPASGIESVLKKYYGDVRLSAALTDIVVTAYDQGQNKAWLFKSREAKASVANDVPMWYASRATSAAPTYFPNIDDLVDGGMMGCMNPSMVALTEAQIAWPGEPVFLLSIGTGSKVNTVAAGPSAEWGQLEYAAALISMFLEAPEALVERECREAIPDKMYYRIQKTLTGPSPDSQMDNVSPEQYQALVSFSEQMIQENLPVLNATVALLTDHGQTQLGL
jgi:patatin-like phospholipase/acyl hydrolase